MPPIAVFLNPNARKMRGVLPDYHRALALRVGREGTVHLTQTLAELAVAVRGALAHGARYLVADGGDGSLHCLLQEVRRALVELGRDPETLPAFAPTRSGSIDFVARRVGIQGGTELILRRLVHALRDGQSPPIVPLPSLRVTGTRRDEDDRELPFESVGFALAAGGVGQRFFDKYYRESPGKTAIAKVVGKSVAAFGLARVGLTGWLPEGWQGYGDDVFEPTHARVTIDGERVPTERHGAIHAGAFAVSLGGVFRVFPLAAGGRLHFQAGGITPPEMIAALPRLVRGKTLASAHLVEVAGTTLEVESLGRDLLHPILDGEDLADVVRLRVEPGPLVPILELTRPPRD